jgi:hypothetical protein
MQLLTHSPVLLLIMAAVAIMLLSSQGVIGTLIAQLHAGNMFRESALGNEADVQLANIPPQTGTLSTSSTSWGIGFPKITLGQNVGLGYIGSFRIPSGTTLTTGITLYISTTDDGAFASDIGNTCVLGVECRKVTAANTLNVYGTATEETITMASPSGTFVQTAFAIPAANLNGAGPGDRIQVRVYRHGASASDLCFGRILIAPDITVEDT